MFNDLWFFTREINDEKIFSFAIQGFNKSYQVGRFFWAKMKLV